MTQCCIASCASSDSYKFNGQNMAFFKVPVKRAFNSYRGEDSQYKISKNNVKNCQHHAWMNAIAKGCKDGIPKCEDEKNMRICICHFHPSVVHQNSSGKCMLKNGALPTMRMTKFSKENGKCAEESSLPRIAGKVEDLQCMRNHEQKLKMPLNRPMRVQCRLAIFARPSRCAFVIIFNFSQICAPSLFFMSLTIFMLNLFAALRLVNKSAKFFVAALK